MYARVVVDTGPASSIDSLTYEIPLGLAEEVVLGSCVLVPLGPRQAVGYIIGFEASPAVADTRPILARLDSPVHLTSDMLGLARWISEEYICPLPRVIAGMLPGVLHCRVQARVARASSDAPLTGAERELFELIPAEKSGVTVESLCDGRDRAAVLRAVRRLEAKGAISREYRLIAPSGKLRVLQGVRMAGDGGEWKAESGKQGHEDGPAFPNAGPGSPGLQPELPRPSLEGDDELPPKQAEVMKVMRELGRDASLKELSHRFNLSSAAISGLRKKGILEPVKIVTRRDPTFSNVSSPPVTLTGEQQAAVDAIGQSIGSGVYQGYLIHGVTASGKTEVYMRCIARALSLGKTSLVLLPEIALTTQVMNIFKSRFGDKVAVVHSALSAGERCDEWTRIERGEAPVVLGARSAVFAPLTNLGLVVVDEEHEDSYKQDSHPRYHGRETARRRAVTGGAALVIGSATPSVESYYLAKQGEYRLLNMTSRVEGRPMPEVLVTDLREGYAMGKPVVFSSLLREGIQTRLARREQVILFLNRRAYSTFLLCRDCGFVMRCPNCAVSLKFHSAQRKLSCHHCNYARPAPDTCPSCGGGRLGRFGIGTERVAEAAAKLFPEARVIRMDRDTTSRRGAHEEILGAFRRGEADILVGTQMIAKGLDFPNVTLVGVISADTSLNLPDFRAAERTFQLLSQVAGRSGRGAEPGEVVIQTFDPDNYAIQCAARHDYAAFYGRELELRRELGYPPFRTLVNVVSRDADERAAMTRLEKVATAIKASRGSRVESLDVVGPAPAVLARLKGEYTWHLMLRSPDREAMLHLIRDCLDACSGLRRNLTVDVDPVSML